MRPGNRREPANVGLDDPLSAMSGGGPNITVAISCEHVLPGLDVLVARATKR